jgi:hypothetical protein
MDGWFSLGAIIGPQRWNNSGRQRSLHVLWIGIRWDKGLKTGGSSGFRTFLGVTSFHEHQDQSLVRS